MTRDKIQIAEQSTVTCMSAFEVIIQNPSIIQIQIFVVSFGDFATVSTSAMVTEGMYKQMWTGCRYQHVALWLSFK